MAATKAGEIAHHPAAEREHAVVPARARLRELAQDALGLSHRLESLVPPGLDHRLDRGKPAALMLESARVAHAKPPAPGRQTSRVTPSCGVCGTFAIC